MASALVLYKKFPGITLHAMNHGDPLPEIGRDEEVYFVDFSLKAKEMMELARRCSGITVIDHHKTAEAELSLFHLNNVHVIFDLNESGASLAWKFLHPDKPLPNLIKYIADRDLWKFDEINSHEINAYIQSFPMSIHEYDMMLQELDQPEGLSIAYVAGAAIERYKATMVQAMCKTATLTPDGIPTVNASMLFSEVGDELCKMFPDAPYAQYYFDRLSDNTRQWGARSIGDFDVSEVAKANGGGGHKNAAGWVHQIEDY